MKVLVIGPQYFNYTDSVAWAFSQLGYTVRQQTWQDFWQASAYWIKKLHKWGITRYERDYYGEWNRQIAQIYRDFRPDMCFILNGDRLFPVTLELFCTGGSRMILWLIDSISRMPHNEANVPYYHSIFSFEHRDEQYLQEKYGIHCEYCPVGYDSRIYYPDANAAKGKDIDISFVGAPVANRVAILTAVAAYARKSGKLLAAYGEFWDSRYFWKQRSFIKRYDPLQYYAHNHNLWPQQVAEIYRRSKICLNIHIPEHEGVNPRTFEILATASFQLVDRKPKLNELLRVGVDVIAYDHTEDLLSKLDYYLKHDSERENIAQAGYKRVRGEYSMLDRVKHILHI